MANSQAALQKMAEWGRAGWEKAKDTTKRARDRLARVEWESQQSLNTGIVAMGTVVAAPLGAYAGTRLFDEEHHKMVAAVGSTLALVGGVVAVVEPEMAPYMLTAASLFSGPATYLAGKKGADDRAEAKAKE